MIIDNPSVGRTSLTLALSSVGLTLALLAFPFLVAPLLGGG
jgi:hypothetical protein